MYEVGIDTWNGQEVGIAEGQQSLQWKQSKGIICAWWRGLLRVVVFWAEESVMVIRQFKVQLDGSLVFICLSSRS